MKFINFFSLVMLLAGCSGKSGSFEQFRQLLQQNEQNAIIISCVRCGCVIEDINHILQLYPSALKDYIILTDTTCTGPFVVPVKMRHVPQAAMDSLSMDFYNVLIIKTQNEKIKMVKTEESEKMLQFLQ